MSGTDSAFWYNGTNARTPAAEMVKKMRGPTKIPAPAFNDIYRDFKPKILRYLTRMVGVAEAEDLVQDVFLKVNQGLKRYDGRAGISTWIYRIATNAAIDHLRKPSTKHRKLERAPAASPATGNALKAEEVAVRPEERESEAETSVIQDEMFHCLKGHIDQLPIGQRAVVILGFLEGLTNGEIAKILGVSLSTAKIRLHRGRTRLAKALEEHCGWFRDARNHLTWDGKIL